MVDPWTYAAKTRNEYAEQAALFMWANMAQHFGVIVANDPLSYTQKGYAKNLYDKPFTANIPLVGLKWLHSINNNAGKGDAIRGAMAKAQGVKAFIPDIFLPVPRYPKNGYNEPMKPISGYYIELKRLASERGAKGKANEGQLACHADLRAAGYKVDVFEGWELARDGLLSYLGVTT